MAQFNRWDRYRLRCQSCGSFFAYINKINFQTDKGVKMNGKSDIFDNELSLINNNALRGFIARALDNLPDYFYEMPASTTGKYHPRYTLGTGGLVRHTKAAVAIAAELMRLDMYSHIKKDWDYIIAALIMHDSVKKGKQGGGDWTAFDHPLQAADYLTNRAHAENVTEILDPALDIICGLIRSHMGQWTTDRDGHEILPKPLTASQKFVHMCDFLASRKFITVTKPDGTPLD